LKTVAQKLLDKSDFLYNIGLKLMNKGTQMTRYRLSTNIPIVAVVVVSVLRGTAARFL
jgi:hypothetical protein